MPTELAHSLFDMHISSPGEDNSGRAFCDMEIPAILLESLRPDLVQSVTSSSSESTSMELVDKDAGSESLESIIDLATDAQCFKAEIIDLTGED